MSSTKKNLLTSGILFLCLLLVSIPRFNRNDMGILEKFTQDDGLSYSNDEGVSIEKLPLDAYQYILITEYFRGKSTIDLIQKPYSDRPLVPIIASILPFDPMTSINILNFLFMLASLYFIYKTISLLGFSEYLLLIGCLLFIFSFPTFYYGVIGNIDPAVIFLLSLGLFLLLLNKWHFLVSIFLLGPFIKESVVILIPVCFYYTWVKRNISKIPLYWCVAYSIVFITFYFVSKNIIQLPDDSFWFPSVKVVVSNLLRPRTFLSFFLSFGIPGLLSVIAIYQLLKNDSSDSLKKYMPMIVGLVCSILLSIYAVLSAYSDGRFIWLSYPFSILLSIYYLDKMVIKIKLPFIKQSIND